MTLSAQDAGPIAQGLWSNATSDEAFWNAVISLAATNRYQPADMLVLLDAIRSLCDDCYTGAYTVASFPGGTPGGPITQFTGWATYAYLSAADVQGVLNLLVDSGMRRDAVTDIARLSTAWLGEKPLFPSPIPPLDPTSKNGPAWMQYLQGGLTVAGTASLAVPVVGPYIGPGLQALSALLHIFFPNNGGDQIPDVLADVKTLFVQQEIQDAATGVYSDGSWLMSIYNLLDAAGDVPPDGMGPWLTANIQTPISEKLSSDTLTDADIQTLVSLANVPGVIELIVYGVSTYIALCRAQVANDLTLASLSQSNGDLAGCLDMLTSANLDFIRFQQAVAGAAGETQTKNANWACQLNGLLFQVAAGRLIQIGSSFSGVQPVRGSVEDKGTPKGTTAKTKDYNPPPLPTPAWMSMTKYEFMSGVWTPYVISVAGALDQLYSDHFACIASWSASIAEWTSQLPLDPPDWAPNPGPTSWTATAPDGQVWVSGAQVKYAVAYANQTGTTVPGPWTDPIAVTTGACPVLTLQPAADGSASTFWIFRQVAPSGEQAFNGPVAVGSVAASANMFTDTDTTDLGPLSTARPRPQPDARAASSSVEAV